MGGLFAAHLLRSLGWEVSVHERASEDLAGRGAGIGTRPELFAVLRRYIQATVSAAEAKMGFRDIDTNDDGLIDFDEFVAWWTED